MTNLRGEQPAPPVHDDDIEVVALPLRVGRRLEFGVHAYQQRSYWHLRHTAQQRDGTWAELRRLSFPLSTAEPFATAFSKLLEHIRTGSAS